MPRDATVPEGITGLAALLPEHDLGEQLGHGGFGVVFAAVHRSLDRMDAVKRLAPDLAANPETRARFVAEGRLLARLDHPHIVRVHHAVQSETVCALVMERLGAGTLRKRFVDGLTQPQSCASILAVLAAVEYAHQHHVLHRDIKPVNILFAANNTPKVVDFGIAQILGGGETLSTRDGEALCGTPAYMSPEQALGQPLGPNSDVYSTGVVLYELLSGRPPHPHDGGNLDVLRRVAYERPRPIGSSVPHALATVTMRALAQQSDHRYASAEEFALALAAATVETYGPDWLDAVDVPVHLPPTVQRALTEAASSRHATTVVLPALATIRPVAPAPVRTPPPRPERPRGAELVPIQNLVPQRKARWRLATLAAVLVLVAALLAFVVPGAAPDGSASSGDAELRLAGAAHPAVARADLSEPLPATGVGVGTSPGSYQARLTVSAAGVSLGQGTSEPFTTTPGQGWTTTVNLRSWTRWVAGGAVRGRLELLPAAAPAAPVASTEITIRPVQAPYVTAMGAGSLLLILFALAYLESVLRALRYGERAATGPFVAGAAGAMLGFATWLAASAFTHREPSLTVAVSCTVLAAAAGAVAAVAARRTVPR